MLMIENVVIIWSGPAGHTAAIYAGRAMLNPLMFEGFLAGGIAAGGQLTTTTEVENYPGFADWIQWPALMAEMRQQSLNSGCRIETKTVDSVDLSVYPYKVFVGKNTIETKSLIITTWAIAKRLNLSGEEKYWQRGISACAVCDGWLPFFRNNPLIVIWGWDTAAEESNYLSKFGSKVYLLVRKDALRASKAMQQKVFNNPKIEVLWNTEWKEVLGNDVQMTGLSVVNNQTWEETVIEASGLFYAIGHKPNTEFLQGQVAVDETWYIKTQLGTVMVLKPGSQEVFPGVFAAWDVQDHKYRQAITSAGTGCMAAMDAEHFLGS